MSDNMKYFLILTVVVCHLGVGLLVGYHYGSQHGYASGKFDMIRWCEALVQKTLKKCNKPKKQEGSHGFGN